MQMNEIDALARRLGPHALAEAIQTDPRNLRRWRSGERPVSRLASFALRCAAVGLRADQPERVWDAVEDAVAAAREAGQ